MNAKRHWQPKKAASMTTEEILLLEDGYFEAWRSLVKNDVMMKHINESMDSAQVEPNENDQFVLFKSLK